MSTTAVREKHKEGHVVRHASLWEAAAQVGAGGIGGVGATVIGGIGGTVISTSVTGTNLGIGMTGTTVYVYGTASNSSSMTIATYLNEPAVEEEEYFKPHFAKHLREILAAPLDTQAPEDEQKFIDWLNSD